MHVFRSEEFQRTKKPKPFQYRKLSIVAVIAIRVPHFHRDTLHFNTLIHSVDDDDKEQTKRTRRKFLFHLLGEKILYVLHLLQHYSFQFTRAKTTTVYVLVLRIFAGVLCSLTFTIFSSLPLLVRCNC